MLRDGIQQTGLEADLCAAPGGSARTQYADTPFISGDGNTDLRPDAVQLLRRFRAKGVIPPLGPLRSKKSLSWRFNSSCRFLVELGRSHRAGSGGIAPAPGSNGQGTAVGYRRG